MSKNQNLNNEIKKTIIDSYNSGNSATAIASILRIPRSTISSVISRYIKTGIINKKVRVFNTPTKLNADNVALIKRWIDEDCSLSLNAIKDRCTREFNISVSTSTIRKTIIGFNYSLKRVHMIPERRNTLSNIEERFLYAQKFLSLGNEYGEHQTVFIDEVGFNVSMRASRGRSQIGNRAVLTVPAIRTRNISVCCAITKSNVLHYEASLTAYNVEKYLSFLTNLIFKLNEQSNEKFIFIMDNVKFHKSNEIKSLIETAGFELLYLPPYSPFLNPIENMFSKWKEHVRRNNPENEQALMALISNGMRLITDADLNGYFRNMMRYILKCINRDHIVD